MITYRMYSANVQADENVIDLIKKQLEETEKLKLPKFKVKFVGFEGEAGTEFYLNNQIQAFQIPECGKFITPFDGDRYMQIFSLKFAENFNGNIYYIV